MLTAVERATRWNRANPERRRSIKLKNRYGITLEDYEAMVVAQDGRCAICRQEGKLDVDHDHDTLVIRGLLCRSCNLMIGVMHEDATRLRAAADYLDAHASQTE